MSTYQHIAHHHSIDVICLQETHVADQLAGRYTIGGFDLISSTPDARFGPATYVHSDVADASPVSSSHFYLTSFRLEDSESPMSTNLLVSTGTNVCFQLLCIPQHTWATSTAITLIVATQNLTRMERPWWNGHPTVISF